MKKIILTLLTASLLTTAMAQTSKCGIETKALLREEVKSGAATLNFLAKMAPNFDIKALESKGISVGAQAGDIVTLHVPVAALKSLEDNKEVLFYSISHPIAGPTCDKTRFDTRTDSVQGGLGVTGDTCFTGEGVYIGITDWGFDYTHINYNSRGMSNWRVDKAWDQFRLQGPAPAGFDYGHEYTTHEEMEAAKCDTSNIYGYGTHGTHVAGICAGKGYDGQYVGQAPKARLLLCSFKLDEASWMDGVEWMRKVAADSARRLVVNSSWGMYSFSCLDGKSLLSQAIDNWSNQGTVFCTSAGNNGNDNFHVMKDFSSTADTLKTVAQWYPSSTISNGVVLILWGEEGQSFSAGVRTLWGSDTVDLPFFNTADGDTIVYGQVNHGSDSLTYRALVERANPLDNRPHIELSVYRTASPELQLFVTATGGVVHAWNVANRDNHAGNMGCAFKQGSHADFTAGDNNFGIGEPACASKAISVAAHQADRYSSFFETYTPGDLASFSSYGPLINGNQKPEISAPGVNVVSSISTWTEESYTPVFRKSFLGTFYNWAEMSGTSMSSPAATGVVALMLQANPRLSVDQIRNIVTRTARNDEKTGPLHERDSVSLRWGWGKIDALAAVNEALRLVDIQQAEELRAPIKVFPNPANGMVRVNTGCGERQTLTVYSLDGRTVMQTPVSVETTLDVSHWNKGIYILRTGSRTAKLIVR